MSVFIKQLNNADAGSSSKVGGLNWDNMDKYFSNTDVEPTLGVFAKIATKTVFSDQKFQLWNPAKTFMYIHDTDAITANRLVRYPILTADDTLVFTNAIQTVTLKQIGDRLDFTRVSAPINPATNEARIYNKQIDTENDGLFCKIKKNSAFQEVQIL